MKYMYDVSVIIVNYNGKRYIKTLFDSLINQVHDDFSFEVVFVDNASTDISLMYIELEEYEKKMNLRIVKSKENLGFAGGNNVGVKACKGEYIVLLNNDTKVEPDWLSNMYHFMKGHPEASVVNSKLLFFNDFMTVRFETKDNIIINKDVYINGKRYFFDNKFCTNILYEPTRLVCIGNSEIHIPLIQGEQEYEIRFHSQKPLEDTDCIYIGSQKMERVSDYDFVVNIPLEVAINEKYALIQNAGSGVNETHDGYDIGFCEKDGEKFNHEYEINNGCGAAIMMKTELFIKAGMFNEKFFMYYEDTDLSYRMKKYGKILFCPNAVVRHIHTGSSSEWSPFFTYQVYRNKLLFIYYNISKEEYKKYYAIHMEQGIAENNQYKIRGCEDAQKIIANKRNIHF